MEELPLETWKKVVDTNLTGVFVCTQEAIKIMKAQTPKGGRIINNGSISAHTPRPRAAAYTATKHAVTGLTKQTALDCRNDNILCSQIDIGNAATPLTERMVQGQGVLQPDGRMMIEARMNADDVGKAVVYIANLPLDTNVLFMTVMANGCRSSGGADDHPIAVTLIFVPGPHLARAPSRRPAPWRKCCTGSPAGTRRPC